MSARTNGIGTPSRDQGMNALPPPQQEHPESERVDSVAKREISEIQEEPSSRKTRRIVCAFEGCEKSLTLVMQEIKCRCERSFCNEHKFYLHHKCTYDYQKQGQADLEKRLKGDANPKIRQGIFKYTKGANCY